ncbi:MAG: CDP-alcohol phosphatidyltransferase family protein [Candidatus Aminicenantes bacterium]|jgi:phosphatidylglycerophosphate synthase
MEGRMIQTQQKWRTTYEAFSFPLGKLCLKLGLTPNILTISSFLCAAGAGVCFWLNRILLGVLMVVLTVFTDMLDGATARAGNMGTAFGGILDHVFDRYGEALIMIGIALSGIVHPVWCLFALFGMIIASYTREAAEAIGKIENVAVGYVGRLQKLFIIMIGAILEYFLPGNKIFTYAIILVGAVSYITSFQRLLYAHKTLNRRKGE